MEREMVEKKTAGAGGGQGAAKPPVFELSSYEPVEFEMPVFEIGDEQVEAQMRAIADEMGANYVELFECEAKPRDTVKVDLAVTRDGEPVKSLSADGRLFVMGEGFMPIEFDRALLGMRPGQECEFDFSASGSGAGDAGSFASDGAGLSASAAVPADSASAQGGAQGGAQSAAQEPMLHAKVKLLAVMGKEDPVFTDEWVRGHLPPFEGVDDFRAQTRNQMEAQAARSVEQEKNMRAVQALTERFDGEIEDSFYEVTIGELRRGWETRARREGMDLEDLIGKEGMNEQQFSMMLAMQARETLVQSYSLDAWARHYGIEPDDADISELADLMAPGHAEELLEHAREDDPELEGMKIAARRYAANKDLTARAKIR